MAPIKNGKVVFNSIPHGFPEPGKTTVYDESEIIDLGNVPLNGGILIKTLEISVDPYFRGRMRDPSIKSYSPPFALGKPLGGGVGVVIRPENAKFKAGDHITGTLLHQEYFVAEEVEGFYVLDNPLKLPWSTFIGVLGMLGLTSYAGWKEHAHAKKGEVAFVTGAVGTLVIQLAKLDGLKVIASAGSDDKVEYMKALGADVVFNHKTTKTAEILEKEGPIDIYWDNVGGETLDAALNTANFGARFIECGMISGYNNGGVPVNNLIQVVIKSITISGFIVFRIAAKYALEFHAFLAPKVASGEVKHKEHIFHGLQSDGEAILALQKGTNTGKAVVHVADDV